MQAYNKLFVALIMVAANVVYSKYQIDLGIDEQIGTAIVNGVGAFLVWLVPNKTKKPLPAKEPVRGI